MNIFERPVGIVQFNRFTGLFAGEVSGIREKGDYRSVVNEWGDMAPEYALELTSDDGEGLPTGRVFWSDHTSESLKAHVLGRQIIIDVRYFVEDLSADRGTWTAAEAEIEATYHLLTSRNVNIECCDSSSGYQAFVDLLLAEGAIPSVDQETRDNIILGKLIRDLS
ncbi:MAG: hypothetical protein HN683_04595 [Gammaproteobacteria bacterium]|jgi:hypothetical protein|nr:hypothetical protein [Gammaproteobacteria bacterium]